MNRAELIDAIQDKADRVVSKAAVKSVLTAYEQVVIDTVTKGGTVRQTGFGQFFMRTTPARMGRNPQTGEPIQIPQAAVPKFKAFHGFKDANPDN